MASVKSIFFADDDRDFISSPQEVTSDATGAMNGHAKTIEENTTSHYRHSELDISQGVEKTHIIDDDVVIDKTVISGDSTVTVHAEQHTRKIIFEGSLASTENKVIMKKWA